MDNFHKPACTNGHLTNQAMTSKNSNHTNPLDNKKMLQHKEVTGYQETKLQLHGKLDIHKNNLGNIFPL